MPRASGFAVARAARRIVHLLLFAGAVSLRGATVHAQAPPPEQRLGASNNLELSLVVATGNARSTSVGFRNVYTYRWTGAEFGWEGGWLRAASRDGSRFAVAVGSGFEVVEPGRAVDSHRLFSKLRYQHQFRPQLDWFANFDAVRDEPSNINRQFVLAAGLGNTWWKVDRFMLRTAYGLNYTDEDLAVERAERFAGYRLSYGLRAGLTSTARLESELTADGSFEAADDIRVDWLNGVSVALNTRLALKSSVRMLFRNLPALESIELRTVDGATIGRVEIQKDKIDTNLTTSFVITF